MYDLIEEIQKWADTPIKKVLAGVVLLILVLSVLSLIVSFFIPLLVMVGLGVVGYYLYEIVINKKP